MDKTTAILIDIVNSLTNLTAQYNENQKIIVEILKDMTVQQGKCADLTSLLTYDSIVL